MSHFQIEFAYSSGSWARMLKSPDNRTAAVGSLLDSLGGSLESFYWDVDSCSAHAIAILPDSVSAAAVVLAAGKTDAFKAVETRELLTEDQLGDALALAKGASQAFGVPGHSILESDLK
jgi:uncharacterized protein with GYD domain